MRKQRFAWLVANLLVAILLAGGASCASATVSTPTSNPALVTPMIPSPLVTPAQSWSTDGTIINIDGNTLTLTTEQGLVTVNINSDIAIQNTMLANLWDLHDGQFLFVIGNQDSNNNITATSILIRSQNQSAPPTPPVRDTSPGRTPRQTKGANGFITQISGNTLILITQQGTVKVKISSDTTIRRIERGTISNLGVGVPLSIIGRQDINGNITATYIHIRP